MVQRIFVKGDEKIIEEEKKKEQTNERNNRNDDLISAYSEIIVGIVTNAEVYLHIYIFFFANACNISLCVRSFTKPTHERTRYVIFYEYN